MGLLTARTVFSPWSYHLGNSLSTDKLFAPMIIPWRLVSCKVCIPRASHGSQIRRNSFLWKPAILQDFQKRTLYAKTLSHGRCCFFYNHGSIVKRHHTLLIESKKTDFLQQGRQFAHLMGTSLFKHPVKIHWSYGCQQTRSKSQTAKHIFGVSIKDDRTRRLLEDICTTYNQNVKMLEKDYADLDAGKRKIMRDDIIKETPLVEKYGEYLEKLNELKEMDVMLKENGDDKDIAKILRKEKQDCHKVMDHLEIEILTLLVPPNTGPADDCDIMMEFKSGAGGLESMLFCYEIFQMYQRYAGYKGWTFDTVDFESPSSGSLTTASVSVSGPDVYRCMKFEGGVHRVQRVPVTEKTGRIHTSTMSVTVLPQPSDIDVELKPSDLEIQVMHASGPGGQHVNKTQSAVRIKHIPTGIAVKCQKDKSQARNQSLALQMLKSQLYNKEEEEKQQKLNSQRKLQVASLDRSEKIRTYNFPQDRITDHRIKENVSGVEEYMEGGSVLDDMVEMLQGESLKERLEERLMNYGKS